MRSLLSILVSASVALGQSSFASSTFALGPTGDSLVQPKRFALTAGMTNLYPGTSTMGVAFVVGREVPTSGGAAQITVQQIAHAPNSHAGVLGWSTTVPLQLGQTDADGIAVITNELATKVFVAGWTKTSTGKDIIVAAYDGATGGTPLWTYTYSNFEMAGDDVPVQIEWDIHPTNPSLNAIYVGGTSDGLTSTGASSGKDIVLIKLKEGDGTPFNANWTVPYRFKGAANGSDTFSEMAVKHRTCPPPEGATVEYNRVFVGGTSFQGAGHGNDYVVLTIDPTTATDVAPPTFYNSSGGGNDLLASLDAHVIFDTFTCAASATVAVTGTTNGGGDSTNDYMTLVYTLSPSAPTLLSLVWGGGATVGRYDGADTFATLGSDLAAVVKIAINGTFVAVTGSSWNGAAEGYNFVTIKYNILNGSRSWEFVLPNGIATFNHPMGSAEDRVTDMVIDKENNMYVGGYSYTGSASGLDFCAISYWPTPALFTNFIERWTVCVGGMPQTNDRFITNAGGGNGADRAGSIRVTRYGGQIDHIGDVYLYGLFANAASKFTVVKHRQADNACP